MVLRVKEKLRHPLPIVSLFEVTQEESVTISYSVDREGIPTKEIGADVKAGREINVLGERTQR